MENFELLQIKREVEKRSITRVCHFTQARKLAHIFGEIGGIASTSWLKKHRPDLLDSTDPRRLDGHPDHISCSIQYPNVWYLGKAQLRERLFKNWVILFIKPDVLWQRSTLFCDRNSATESGRYLASGIEAFSKMFASKVKTYKRGLNMPLSCPTDGQAEVMIYRFIKLELIFGIAAPSKQDSINIQHNLEDIGISTKKLENIKWSFSSELFNSKRRIREKLVRYGVLPTETVLTEDDYE